jgi:hypothetical protein
MAAEATPIVDKYSGTDFLNKSGHFLTLFSGYDLTTNLQAGVKYSRVWFDREGEFGSKNLWESDQRYNSSSLWANGEGRSQDYTHWDIAAGVKYSLSEKYSFGATGGYLKGDATQQQARTDSSFYMYGQTNAGTNWSYYTTSGRTQQNWDHDGKSFYTGLDFSVQFNEKQTLNCYYHYTRQNIDLALASAINDTSYNAYRSRYDTTTYTSTGFSRLSDMRHGSGTTTGNIHRAMAVFRWRVEPRMHLSVGVQYASQRTKTHTDESVVAQRRSYYSYTGQYPSTYLNALAEQKNLLWDFSTKRTDIQFPIILTWKVSDNIELLFGLNRRMSTWEIEDVTLALFRYREENNNGTITRRENFGERYTYPREKESDVQTTALGGITVYPSKLLNIRLLVVPNFVDDPIEGSSLQDLMWWISVGLLP